MHEWRFFASLKARWLSRQRRRRSSAPRHRRIWAELLENRFVLAAPVALNDSYGAPAFNLVEDIPFVVGASQGVLINDSDADGDLLTAVQPTQPLHGTLTLNANGGFSYIPAADFNGPDSFTYKASDGTNTSNIATVNLTVQAINDPPFVANDFYSGPEDAFVTVNAPGVLLNDSDVENDPLTAVLVMRPSCGTVVFNSIPNSIGSDGSFSYLPQANFYGTDSFTYRARDSQFFSSFVATVFITITPVNDFPIAINDSYVATEDTPLTVSSWFFGVLANDSDVDNPPFSLTAVLPTQPVHGTLVLNADGTFTYTPEANFNGKDSFTYKASDGVATSNAATVTITVQPVNDPPVANNDNYGPPAILLNEDTPLVISAPGVLSNDSDPDFDTIFATGATQPAHGTVTLNSNGSFTYLPAVDFNGVDSFTYKTSDGFGALSNSATVTITVQPVPDVPVAVNDNFVIDEDHDLTISAPGILANDSDVDSPVLAAVNFGPLSNPASGVLFANSDGSITFRPSANFNGPISFTYRATDGILVSNTATATINVQPVNDPPQAANDNYLAQRGGTLLIPIPGVLANDLDVDGDMLTASLVSGVGAGNGTLTGPNADGSFTYTSPTNLAVSTVSFTYRAIDPSGASSTATVTIQVGFPPPPIANNDRYDAVEDTTLTVSPLGVLSNDAFGPDGDTVFAVKVSNPQHGTLLGFSANGSFTYVPSADFNGADSFTYRDSDGFVLTNIATVTINVQSVNDPPNAIDDSGYSVAEDNNLTVPGSVGVLANDSDADGNILTAVLVAQPAHGNVVLNAAGGFTYVPHNNFSGFDSFTYRATDGQPANNLSNTATVTITVVPDQPFIVARDDHYAGQEDTPLEVTLATAGVLANDIDVDGSAILATIVFGPAHGLAFLNTDGTFTYTPAANFNGLDSFTYQARDGFGTVSNVATVTITLTAINDPPVANDETINIVEDQVIIADPPGVLLSCSDIDGDPLSALLVSGTQHGTLETTPAGSFSYSPDPKFYGIDSFTYRASDGKALSNIATVTINIAPINDAPTATIGVFPIVTTDESGPQTITNWVTNVSTGPPNESGQKIDFSIAVDNPGLFLVPPALVLQGADTAALTYTPKPNVAGTTTFFVQLHDDGGRENGGKDTTTYGAFTITINKPHRWHNARDVFDVNDDDFISPIDALLVINSINAGIVFVPLNASIGKPLGFIDVDGDNFIAPLDALLVINRLNRGPPIEQPPGLGEGEGADADLFLLLAQDLATQSPRRRQSP
jgi:VCBS repeat-containing protein